MDISDIRIVLDETNTVIRGEYDEQTWWGVVTVDGKPLNPKISQRVANHSPDGFSWGYSGSGPMQLALGILLAAGVRKADATAYCIRFRQAFIEALPRASFVLKVDVQGWLRQQKA